jgi:hypothetical protein
MRRITILILLFFLLFFLPINLAAKPAELKQQYPEYITKAVSVGIISVLIEWPEISGMSDLSKSFIIGIFGESEFNDALKKKYTSNPPRKIKGKNVQIIEFSDIREEEILNCHVLVIAEASKKELLKIISITRGKPVLTFADKKRAAERGVIINLSYGEEEYMKLRPVYELNEKALKESSLTADSSVFKNAEKIFSSILENK